MFLASSSTISPPSLPPASFTDLKFLIKDFVSYYVPAASHQEDDYAAVRVFRARDGSFQ